MNSCTCNVLTHTATLKNIHSNGVYARGLSFHQEQLKHRDMTLSWENKMLHIHTKAIICKLELLFSTNCLM